jgi:Lon protease-like protein
MSGRTVSAYADETTAQRIVQLAKAESRSPAQIAAAALRLYAILPTDAHQAFRQIEALGSQTLIDRVQRALTRVLIDGVYEAARKRALAQMQVGGRDDDSEEDILAQAVRLTSPR